MASVIEIRHALSQLDPANDEHWTQNGAPGLDNVIAILGQHVKRAEVTAAAPEFTRTNMALPAGEGDGTVAELPEEADDALEQADLPSEEPLDEGEDLVSEEEADPLVALRAQYDANVARTEQINRAIDELIRERKECEKLHAELSDALDAKTPARRFEEENRMYQAKQRELREQADGPAPLDAALRSRARPRQG